jgi:hypothetical protein
MGLLRGVMELYRRQKEQEESSASSDLPDDVTAPDQAEPTTPETGIGSAGCSDGSELGQTYHAGNCVFNTATVRAGDPYVFCAYFEDLLKFILDF